VVTPVLQVLPPSVLQEQAKVVFFEVRLPRSIEALTTRWTIPVAGIHVAARRSLVGSLRL
jgi:hypothetical protein